MQDHDNTSVRDLLRACEIGREEGLRYVYAGNIPGHVGDWENTYCPGCGVILIQRHGFLVLANRVVDGACPDCSTPIAGIWTRGSQRGSGEVPQQRAVRA
jgi:pyruvate formate lyase activating enzyme